MAGANFLPWLIGDQYAQIGMRFMKIREGFSQRPAAVLSMAPTVKELY